MIVSELPGRPRVATQGGARAAFAAFAFGLLLLPGCVQSGSVGSVDEGLAAIPGAMTERQAFRVCGGHSAGADGRPSVAIENCMRVQMFGTSPDRWDR
jgi:hypothetical protein